VVAIPDLRRTERRLTITVPGEEADPAQLHRLAP
jgi:hypothetical protein